MRKMMGLSVLIAAAMLLVPLSALSDEGQAVAANRVTANISDTKAEKVEVFRVCASESGEVSEIKTEDYIFGVVAAEMPALYHEEALKAQAVAAYTYACSRKAQNKNKSYDITTDHTLDQSYITETKAREKWGENADEYIDKIKGAVNAVKGYMITYNGSPITAVYHAISAGKTEDCKDIWGSELAYLKPVTSEGDKLSANYISEEKFTAEKLKEKLTDEVVFEGDAATWFGKSARTDSGTVTEIKLCNETLRGDRIRSVLGLRSSNFEVKYSNGEFIFTVYGYGHGVGMSQNGANYMAKQGSNFKEILNHYYTDCKIEKVK